MPQEQPQIRRSAEVERAGEQMAGVDVGGVSLRPKEEVVRLRKRPLLKGLEKLAEWIRVLSWNLNGARARWKDGSFEKVIAEFDVLCFTEFRCPRRTFLKKKGVRDALRNLGFLYWAEHVTRPNGGYGGVVIISKVPFDCA